jgi:hypothetical protein
MFFAFSKYLQGAYFKIDIQVNFYLLIHVLIHSKQSSVLSVPDGSVSQSASQPVSQSGSQAVRQSGSQAVSQSGSQAVSQCGRSSSCYISAGAAVLFYVDVAVVVYHGSKPHCLRLI